MESVPGSLCTLVGSLTEEQLAIRAAPDVRSVAEIATHVVAGRAFWFHKVLKEGDKKMAAIAQWDRQGQPSRTSIELAQGFQTTWALVQNSAASWTPEQISEMIVLPWIGPEYPITCAWVLWHVLEHDLHHGGEVTYTPGMQGLDARLPPPPPER